MKPLGRWRRSRTDRGAGYSLLELLVTLAILGVLAGATASLRQILGDTALAGHVNLLLTDLWLSRSEAVTRTHDVVICQSANGRSCTAAPGWHEGWIVFADTDGNHERDAGDALLRVQPALSGPVTIRLYASAGHRGRVVFQPSGGASSMGHFTLCDLRRPLRPQRVVYYRTGRVRTQPDDPGACAG